MLKSFPFFTLLTLSIISCSKPDYVSVGGSTTVLPILSNAAEVFQLQNPDYRIIVNAGGSGVAINQVGTGQLHIGMISRDLTEEEHQQYSDIRFKKHRIGRDAVLPVVSSDIYHAGISALSVNEMRQIFTGEITNWSQLDGPDRKILVIDKERTRGTRHIFMKVVMGDIEASVPAAGLVLGANNELQFAISQSNSAFSMLSYNWQNEKVIGLGLKMDDGSVIAPTLENIQNGHYPIVRDLELLTSGEPDNKTMRFIDFIQSAEGQQIVEQAGYVSILQ